MLYGYFPNANKFTSLECTHASILDERDRIDSLCGRGRSVGAGWKPLSVRPRHRTKPLGDFPLLWFGEPIFSERALETLSPLLGDAIEPLPMEIAGKVFYLINILDSVDCLDLEQSKVTINPVSKGISSVQHYVFREDLADHHLFLIPQLRKTAVFVSAGFREKAESTGLVGLYYMDLP
jgi:hypothetical protein